MSAFLRIINIYSNEYNVVCTNLSFTGGGKESESEKNTFNKQCYEPLLSKNILPVTAAGNDSEENNIENLKSVVVSALKNQNGQYVFDNLYSNYGKIVDISAPGTNIRSAGIAPTDGTNSSYVYQQGTSMASPQVAGVVALLYLNPTLGEDFTASDIEQILYDNSLDFGGPNKDIYYGYGILNLKYFESKKTEETLSFYENGTLVSTYVETKNFEQDFTLSMICSDPDFNIIYTTDRNIPTYTNSNNYTSRINVSKSLYVYAIGLKIVDDEIVERTDLYNISYFDIRTPLEDCFTVSNRGYLDNYIGNFTHLNIPRTLKGKTIVGLEPSLFKQSNLQSITLPDTITTIGGYVFLNCKDLKFVYAPNVTKIYKAAFADCESLSLVSDEHPVASDTVGVYLPNLIETIGMTFSGCTNLESVNLSKLEIMGELEGNEFQFCKNLKQVYVPSIKSIPTRSFIFCESLTGNFHIGSKVNEIGRLAFTGCKLTSFSVDEKNNKFYTDGLALYTTNQMIAFALGNDNIDYEVLSSVTINNKKYTITDIGSSVAYQVNFNSLIIPETITLINEFAFSKSNINTLYYNAVSCSDTGYWDAETFMISCPYSTIETLIIGENVQKIPHRMFQSVDLDNLVINSHSTVFETSSFYLYGGNGNVNVNSITFNFTEEIDANYLKMVIDTSHIMVFCDINYIYSKTQFSTTLNNRLKNFIYTTYDGEYYIYSKEPIYSITVTTNEYGKVSLQDDAKYFEEGSDVTYTFTPNIGCYLQSVIIDGKVLTSAEVASVRIKGYTFTNISKNHTISAIFALKDYIIEITSNNFGTIFPNGNVQAKYGEDKTFTIEPNKGYQIQEILVDGVSVDFENNQVTIKNINRNISIHVVFMEQVVPKKLNPMIIILAIGSVILLTFLSVLFSKLRSNAKRKKFQDVMQNILLPENNYKYQRYQTLQQNSNLEKALEFVKGKEQSFMSFCIQNRIDYHKNYNDAVFKYYQAYLQSIKQ